MTTTTLLILGLLGNVLVFGPLFLAMVLCERSARRTDTAHRQYASGVTFATHATLSVLDAAKDISRRTSVEVDALLYDLTHGSCFEVHGLLFTPSSVEDPTSVLVTYA